MRTFTLCAVLVFCFSLFSFGQSYETSFYGEDKLKSPIRIPEKILNVLKKDKAVQRCFGAEPQMQDLRNWFEAAKINLNDDNYSDILIKGKDDIRKKESNCINGNAVSFWLFRKKQNGYELVLRLYTITVEIGTKKSGGFYNINTIRNTANASYTTFYAFKRNKYVEIGKKERPITN
ncbi:MAG TPA: hypothetical protein VNB22_12785 [Pyrinomonadaceae bacterium]|jgi:hypothetical protein|nr:hypothetical protein [Pyrinomonadaceae bacterium]